MVLGKVVENVVHQVVSSLTETTTDLHSLTARSQLRTVLRNSPVICIYMSFSALKFHASLSILSSLSICGFCQLSSPMHSHPSVHRISFFSANATVIGSTTRLFAFAHCQFHDSNWCSFFCYQYRNDHVITHLPSINKRRG